MAVERHLTIHELALRPSGEWKPEERGWTIVRVAEGAGYSRHGGTARELNAGDTVIGGPGSEVVFRASQLGILKLEFFLVLPQYLSGMLTVEEWRKLEAVSNQATPTVLSFAAKDPVAQKFTRLAAQAQRDGLPVRSALLQFWAASIANLLSTPGAGGNSLRERFRQLVGKMPEAELAGCSLTDLAQQLHCSERHFSRLFSEEFNISLRSRQTELRLQRACQLLAESDAKIINVAFESGYRHLGLFNAMFKKRFGVTPSEWRHQNLPAPPKTTFKRLVSLLALLPVMVSWFLMPTARGETASTNSAARRADAATNAVAHFKVEKYLVSGNTVLPPRELGEIFSNVPTAFGTNVTFTEIRSVLGELQMAYRERGFATVSIGLPPQKVTNATVKIKVTEGRLAAINVTGNDWHHYYSSNNVMRALPSLHTNLLLNSHVFQRELDNANASRDRQIYPVISPGLEPGTSDLTLKVKDTLPLHARVEINNLSTPGTPDSRIAFNGQYDNLWQLEHQVGVNYSFTPVNYKNKDNYNDTALDDPLIANYGGYYRMPLSTAEPVQSEVDKSAGSFGYNEVTHLFQLPPPTGRAELNLYASRSTTDTGVQWGPLKNVVSEPIIVIGSQDSGQNETLNQGLGGKLSFPLPTLANIASTFSIGLDFKQYQNASYNTNNFFVTSTITNSDGSINNITSIVPSGQPTRYTSVNYYPINFGINSSRPDAWGSTTFNAQMNYNLATVGSLADLAYSAGAPAIITSNTVTHTKSTNSQNQAKNNYFTVQAGASREQRIYKDWTVLLHADGQWASCPLFSNELFGMGGSAGVRGYEDGEVYGDTGWRASIEPRTPMVNLGMVDGDVPFWVRASVFMDYGQVYRLQPIPPYFPDKVEMWGYGGSLTANIGNHMDARLTVSFPLISSALTQAESVHIYFGVGAQF